MSIENKIIDDNNEDEGESDNESNTEMEKIIFIPKLPGCESLNEDNYKTYNLYDSVAVSIEDTIFITNIIKLARYITYFSVPTYYVGENLDKYKNQELKKIIDNAIDLNFILNSLNDENNIKKYYTASGFSQILEYIQYLPVTEDKYNPFIEKDIKKEYIYDTKLKYGKYIKYEHELNFTKKIIPDINFTIESDNSNSILADVLLHHERLIEKFNRTTLKSFYEVYYLSDFFGCKILCDLFKYIAVIIHNKFIHISYKLLDSVEYAEYNVKYKNKHLDNLFGVVEDHALPDYAKEFLKELKKDKYVTFNDFGEYLLKKDIYRKILTSINSKGDGHYNEKIMGHVYKTHDLKNNTNFHELFYVKNKFLITESYANNYKNIKKDEENDKLDNDLDNLTVKKIENDMTEYSKKLKEEEEPDDVFDIFDI